MYKMKSIDDLFKKINNGGNNMQYRIVQKKKGTYKVIYRRNDSESWDADYKYFSTIENAVTFITNEQDEKEIKNKVTNESIETIFDEKGIELSEDEKMQVIARIDW